MVFINVGNIMNVICVFSLSYVKIWVQWVNNFWCMFILVLCSVNMSIYMNSCIDFLIENCNRISGDCLGNNGTTFYFTVAGFKSFK